MGVSDHRVSKPTINGKPTGRKQLSTDHPFQFDTQGTSRGALNDAKLSSNLFRYFPMVPSTG